MAREITVVSDFVCPYCFWLEALMERVPEHPPVRYAPFQLTRRGEEQVDVAADLERRARYAQTLAPACAALGLDMHLPPQVSPRPLYGPCLPELVLRPGAGRGRCVL